MNSFYHQKNKWFLFYVIVMSNNPNPNPPTAVPTDTFDPIDEQASYVERALYSYLRKAVVGGIEVLKTPPYRIYFWYVMILIFGSIITGALFNLGILITPEILRFILFLEFVSALALILGGICGALFRKEAIIDTFTIVLLVTGAVIAWMFPEFSSHIIIEWAQSGLFILYTILISISLFYIIVYYQSSLYSRIVSVGNSPNRLFFEPVLRLVTWIIIGLSMYLAIQEGRSGFILGVMGFVVGWILLLYLYYSPRLKKDADNVAKDLHNAKMNFRQVLGYFNFYILYNMAFSLNSESNLGNFLVELILLSVNSFFIINNLARKVDNILDIDKEQKKNFRFQSTSEFFMRLKKAIGMKPLILICLGISLGYQSILLGSSTQLDQLTVMITFDSVLNISTFYHRTVLFICLVWIIISMLYFHNSTEYRDMYVNRYTLRHVLAMFGDLFHRKEDGSPSPVEEMVKAQTQKLFDFGAKLRDRFKNPPKKE
jgi:hypothetical protein